MSKEGPDALLRKAVIHYLVPSRGRPEAMDPFFDAFHETSEGVASLEIVLDEDDPDRDDYAEALSSRQEDYRVTVLPGRTRIGPLLNRLAPRRAPHYEGVGFMGDDHRPRTKGWDARIAEAIGRFAVVYGNDKVQGEALPTSVMLSSDLVLAMGGMCVAGMMHMYLDNFWRDLGTALGTLRYLKDVEIEHVHPVTGAVEWDSTYREAAQVMELDRVVYETFRVHEFGELIERIRNGNASV